MKRLDHSMIFVFIAGTYTPLAVLCLPRNSAIAVLVAVWAGALFGVALQTTWQSRAALAVGALLHRAGLGRGLRDARPAAQRRGGRVRPDRRRRRGLHARRRSVYALKRPNPYPGVFGFHEVFHLCTLVAAVCHYVAIWFAVFA